MELVSIVNSTLLLKTNSCSGNYIASCWDSKFWSKDGLGGTDEMCARCSEGGAGSGSKYSCVYLGRLIGKSICDLY